MVCIIWKMFNDGMCWIHLCRFGPLRHQWCMKFEAKNAYIKGLIGKCFKNLPHVSLLNDIKATCVSNLSPHLVATPQTFCTKEMRLETVQLTLVYVTGYEKRDHIAQNAIVCHFSSCHHFKAMEVPGFPLGL